MSGEGQFPDKVMMHVYSVADFGRVNRAARVFEVFDEFPDLRPLKVGPGDPPRLKVTTTMSEAMRGVELPIQYLTVRNNKPQYEGGELNLYEGRGGYTGRLVAGSAELHDPKLTPHAAQSSYAAESGSAHPDLLQITDFFRRLCEEMDAFYGFVTTLNMWRQRMMSLPDARRNPFPQLEHELPDVLWLNYFGPSWLVRAPGLRGLPYSTIGIANGGVVLRTTETPFVLDADADPVTGYPWKSSLVDALGPDTFKFRDQVQAPAGVLVPNWQEHFAVSPGTDEPPWSRWKRDVGQRKQRARERSFPARVRTTEQLCAARVELPRTMGALQFSTSLDAHDFRAFFRKLGKVLRGDFDSTISKAILAEIAAAPVDTERSYQLVAQHDGGSELVDFRYFIDDIEVVDFYLFGSRELVSAARGVVEADT